MSLPCISSQQQSAEREHLHSIEPIELHSPFFFAPCSLRSNPCPTVDKRPSDERGMDDGVVPPFI